VQARSAVLFAVELLLGFQVYGTWNVPTYYFVDGTWNVPTYNFVDGTWNVPTTLTFVSSVYWATGKLNSTCKLVAPFEEGFGV
jgi:hypothetical protein